MAIGISESEFWHLNPHKVDLRIKAYKKMQEQKDYEMWTMGAYVLNAFSTVLSNFLGKKAEYMKEPLHKQNQTQELTQKEKDKQIELLFANLNIMKSNFEASHRKDGGTGNGN